MPRKKERIPKFKKRETLWKGKMGIWQVRKGGINWVPELHGGGPMAWTKCPEAGVLLSGNLYEVNGGVA